VDNPKHLEQLTRAFLLGGCNEWGAGVRLLAAVGKQPTELAVKVQTIKRLGIPIDEIRLLRTKDTKDAAERLEQWLRSKLPRVNRVTADEIHGHSSFLIELESIQAWCRTAKEGYEGPLLVSADPGQAWTLAIMVRALQGRCTTFLHSDVNQLFATRVEEGAERFVAMNLEDVGLRSLLDLYGIMFHSDAVPDHEQDRRRREIVRLELVQAHTLPEAIALQCEGLRLSFDFAYERRGRLFGLRVFDQGDATNRKEAIRNFASFRSHQSLNGLRPEFAGFSYCKLAREHLRSHGCIAFGAKSSAPRLRRWLSRSPALPGRVQSPHSLRSGSSKLTERGRGGKALAVAMGTEPGSTLTSIRAHCPEVVYLICDNGTPDVVEMARRLELLKGQLGVHEINTIAMDVLGGGLLNWWSREGSLITNLVVDVTPGSKMQTRALAQLPGADLWCLRRDQAIGIIDPSAPIPAAQPTSDLIATMRAGKRPVFKTLNRKGEEFHKALRDFVHCLHSSQELVWHQLYDAGLSCRCGKRLSRFNNRLQVEHGSMSCSMTFTPVPNPGDLFEFLVAYSLRSFDKQVVYNMKWEWDDSFRNLLPPSNYKSHKVELDVAFTHGSSTFAISCKTGKDSMGKARREVEAVATFAFGRSYRTVPVLIHPGVTDDLLRSSQEAPSGAVLVPLRMGLEPDDLLECLRIAAESRRKYS